MDKLEVRDFFEDNAEFREKLRRLVIIAPRRNDLTDWEAWFIAKCWHCYSLLSMAQCRMIDELYTKFTRKTGV